MSATTSRDFLHGFIATALSRLLFVVLLAAASSAQAVDCSEFPGGVIDGFSGTPAPSQIQIDRNCTIRNYPASNPLSTNFSFLTQPGQTEERWLIVFDNVVHTGQMACNSVAGHKIWFTNGSSTSIQEGCQNLLIPVEKIDKQNPSGPSTATIGVPFVYSLTMPVLFDPATGTVINTSGSLNDLHGVTVIDDLNATGADLSYVSHVAHWQGSTTPVPHTFSNVGGVLTFDDFPIIPAGQQIVVEVTVVLDATPANVIGTQFINTAKWDFGRLIDGVYYEPLPGEWGISPPMTIAGPDLVLTKTGPATMNLGESGDFTLDVQNSGNSGAWNATIIDRLPDGIGGGMCNITPQILSARVFAADGATLPGKGPLIPGTDFALSYDGAPTCELALTILTAAGAIGPDERLIVAYRTELDADTQDGAILTNVAGATQWFNDNDGNPGRETYARTLTNGTPGVLDHEDAYSVTADLSGYFFEKSVENLTSGSNPATVAAPGDTLRYTLRVQTTDNPLNDFTVYDDLGALNASAVFEPGTLTLVPGAIPDGADTNNTIPNGGTNGAGVLDVRGMSLPVSSELLIQFDITLNSSLIDGSIVTNQADLIRTAKLADSDDPNINGQADPDVPGDEDPTRILIEVPPPPALQKTNTQDSASIGEAFSYLITVPSVAHTVPLYDVRIIDDLAAATADLQFVDVTKVTGSGSWTPVNTGTDTNLVIEDPAGGIDIPAGEQVVVEVTVLLADTGTNVAGLTFANTAAYTYNQLDNDGVTELPGGPGTTAPMTIVEPELTLEKSGPPQMRNGLPGTFTLDVHNRGDSPAYAVYLTDVLPSTASGGMCDATPAQVTARLYEADGVTPIAPALAAGTDFVTTFDGDPACTFTLEMLTPSAAVGPDQRLIVTYQASLDAGTQEDAVLTNVAGATEWFSADQSTPNDRARTYARPVTDGTVGVLDHEDEHTVLVNQSRVMFEKTAVNVTTGENPATVARPNDVIRYTLRIENVGDVELDDFSVVDELDRLNGVAKFRTGTLNVISAPDGADISNTSGVGGTYGSGVLDVRDLTLGLGEVILIEFEATLAPVITNGSYVANQSQLETLGFILVDSDDPYVNGAADPDIFGDEDATRILIESAPVFDVDKISTYIDGDPNVLMAGETLRYTITVQNIGTDHAADTVMRDQIPANTTYVAGSTLLNGESVPDVNGLTPLAVGMAINSPADSSPGYMSADAAAQPSNIAVIEFDVDVYPDLLDGTIVSNQAYVSAIDGGVVEQPSDDPRTAVVDDPTRDVVGNLPLLYAEKSAALQMDYGTPDVVDPGDVLRYTIRVYNNGAVDATNVALMDGVPENTTYVADTLTLNALPVWQPDDGVFPLENGIPLGSTDLTPPIPEIGQGTLSAGGDAIVQFDLRVNDDVATGTLITNQAVVTSEELPSLLTDGDGNPATGPEPTVVVVGPAQQLAITKQVAVVGGGPVLAGSTLEYTVRIRNISVLPALDVEIMDNLDDPIADQLSYVDGSATLNEEPDGVVVDGATLLVDYGDLAAGDSIILRFQAVLNADLAIGTRVTNTAKVYWNATQEATASVAVDIGAIVGVGIFNGSVWHDANYDDRLDGNERLLEGWSVDLYRNDELVHTTVTAADGTYQMSGVMPNYLTGDTLELVFKAPGAGASTALLGRAYSADFSVGLQQISDIVVYPGTNLLNLDLPIDPNGVVYDSVSRVPVPGVRLTLVSAVDGAPVPSSCFDDETQQNQITRADGYYKFDLNFSELGCPSGGTYGIAVVEPTSGYTPGYSEIIPPAGDDSTPPLNVPACPVSLDDAVPATDEHCEVQASEFAPGTSVPARSLETRYHVDKLVFDASVQPGSAQIFNNHIPVDPILEGAVAITKTTPMVNITRGQLVPYTITVTNTYPIELQDVGVVDRFPPGFRYIEGSARFDGVPTEPTVGNRELIWSDLRLTAEGQHTIQLLLGAGAGVSEGEYVNRAQAVNVVAGIPLSGEATATVRLVADPTFDCTDVIGKVFDDDNRNGQQDFDEFGLQGVRLVTAQGLVATTDEHGRFHITCAITPREDRGSNFVLKLDDRTLPSGFRTSTDLVQIKRATRGKALRFNFGASIHRVVGLEVADGVFVPDSTEMRPQWQHRFDILIEELQKAPAILRLTYLADLEDPKLVRNRVRAVKKEIEERWQALDCCYRLALEHDVFWRLGAPAKRAVKRAGERDD